MQRPHVVVALPLAWMMMINCHLNITAVMACNPAGGIVYKNKLPWCVPTDTMFFKQMTLGALMVVGYKTYLKMSVDMLESCSWIVFSSNPKRKKRNACPHSVVFVQNMQDFLNLEVLGLHNKCYMVGGSEIASLFLRHNMIDQFFLTKIKNQSPADRFLPLNMFLWWPSKCIFQTNECAFYYYMNPYSSNLI